MTLKFEEVEQAIKTVSFFLFVNTFLVPVIDKLKGLCHRHRYMNGWYDKIWSDADAIDIDTDCAN